MSLFPRAASSVNYKINVFDPVNWTNHGREIQCTAFLSFYNQLTNRGE